MQLKTSEIKSYREKQLELQLGICPLCYRGIAPSEAALDHCHRTGMVRRVLHRTCNSVEGRILHWAKRNGKIEYTKFIRNLLEYWSQDYSLNPIHPNHDKAKRVRKKKVRRVRKPVRSSRNTKQVLRKKVQKPLVE